MSFSVKNPRDKTIKIANPVINRYKSEKVWCESVKS